MYVEKEVMLACCVSSELHEEGIDRISTVTKMVLLC